MNTEICPKNGLFTLVWTATVDTFQTCPFQLAEHIMTIHAQGLEGARLLTGNQVLAEIEALSKRVKAIVGKGNSSYQLVVRAEDFRALEFNVVKLLDRQISIEEVHPLNEDEPGEVKMISERNLKMQLLAERVRLSEVSAEDLVGSLREAGSVHAATGCLMSHDTSGSKIDGEQGPVAVANKTALPRHFNSAKTHRITGVVNNMDRTGLGAKVIRMRLTQTADGQLFEQSDLNCRDISLTMVADDLLSAYASYDTGAKMQVEAQIRVSAGKDGLKFSGQVVAVLNQDELEASVLVHLKNQMRLDSV